MDFCSSFSFESIIDLLLILVPVEVREISAEFLEIVLVCRSAQNRKVDPAEHVALTHTVEIKRFQRPVKQIRDDPGVIAEGSATKCTKDQTLVSQICGDFQYIAMKLRFR
jgi:hypothetical protein